MSKLPRRPTKPYKPSTPYKEYTRKAIIHTACCFESFTLEYLRGLIPTGVEDKDVTFTVSTESDDYRSSDYGQVTVYALVTKPNETYETELVEYKKKLAEYKKKYAKYKVDKEKYDRLMDEENLKRLEKQLEHAKKRLSRK